MEALNTALFLILITSTISKYYLHTKLRKGMKQDNYMKEVVHRAIFCHPFAPILSIKSKAVRKINSIVIIAYISAILLLFL